MNEIFYYDGSYYIKPKITNIKLDKSIGDFLTLYTNLFKFREKVASGNSFIYFDNDLNNNQSAESYFDILQQVYDSIKDVKFNSLTYVEQFENNLFKLQKNKFVDRHLCLYASYSEILTIDILIKDNPSINITIPYYVSNNIKGNIIQTTILDVLNSKESILEFINSDFK